MSSDELFLAKLLEALESSSLEALIVGTTAAVLQGAPVMTQDVDLLIRDTPKNREKIIAFSNSLGSAKPVGVSPLTKTLTLVGTEIPIDILFDALPGNLTFEAMRSRGVRVPLGKREAMVAALADVIASKKAAGRPKDLAQLPILEQTLRLKANLKATD